MRKMCNSCESKGDGLLAHITNDYLLMDGKQGLLPL